MPRLRQQVPVVRRGARSTTKTTAGVPIELTDENDPAWETVKATQGLLLAIGVALEPSDLESGPITRCRVAGRLWARQAGITLSHGSGKDLDWARMRELGIAGARFGSAEVHERRREFYPVGNGGGES